MRRRVRRWRRHDRRGAFWTQRERRARDRRIVLRVDDFAAHFAGALALGLRARLRRALCRGEADAADDE
jgi:hypothetical protein